jgi:hypothetical protein
MPKSTLTAPTGREDAPILAQICCVKLTSKNLGDEYKLLQFSGREFVHFHELKYRQRNLKRSMNLSSWPWPAHHTTHQLLFLIAVSKFSGITGTERMRNANRTDSNRVSQSCSDMADVCAHKSLNEGRFQHIQLISVPKSAIPSTPAGVNLSAQSEEHGVLMV